MITVMAPCAQNMQEAICAPAPMIPDVHGWRKDMDRLKRLRKERGYTQIQMQHLTGIDQSDYSKIENGKRYYTFEQRRKIALALHTSMDYLADLTNCQKPYPRNQSEEFSQQDQ